ncbi:glycosyltransferase [Burkholderiaceae bacterium]|nr:glycosyltransferase [Burkholderiaceae bacterium]
MPLISVCIPAYNRAGVLPALLDSILNQDFDDFDIVIAEDFSPERPAIAVCVSEYQQRFGEKVKYYENPQTLGYDGNLRRLIELANSDYVLFMGNDDLLASGALTAVARAVGERNNVGVVLRSYASFVIDPAEVVQVFRYFSEDRVFPPGPDAVVTFFRRCVFISGMVFKRSSAAALATARFDGTLLYQQHLAGHILAKESGVYLNGILSYHRLGGVPDFGASAAENGLFVPKQQTPASSVHFMRGMLEIAYSLDVAGGAKVGRRILQDIGNYAYPILSIQAGRSFGTFLSYLWQLMKLGFWRVPLFHGYALGLLVLGRKNCDGLIARIKKSLGRAPILGGVYTGQTREAKGD